jgi:hypothetical protein
MRYARIFRRKRERDKIGQGNPRRGFAFRFEPFSWSSLSASAWTQRSHHVLVVQV